MIIALGSWAMMFGALFFLLFALRARSGSWPPAGVPPLPIALPAINTGVLVASSIALWRGVDLLAKGKRKQLVPWIIATMGLGGAFLGLQVHMWRGIYASGLHPDTGAYGSIFYGFTALHAVHVAGGILALLYVLVNAARGVYSEHNVVRVRNCAWYWHFVDIVWVLMFVSIYLT
jgi:cytochrome c oxidase subunit 3